MARSILGCSHNNLLWYVCCRCGRDRDLSLLYQFLPACGLHAALYHRPRPILLGSVDEPVVAVHKLSLSKAYAERSIAEGTAENSVAVATLEGNANDGSSSTAAAAVTNTANGLPMDLS